MQHGTATQQEHPYDNEEIEVTNHTAGTNNNTSATGIDAISSSSFTQEEELYPKSHPRQRQEQQNDQSIVKNHEKSFSESNVNNNEDDDDDDDDLTPAWTADEPIEITLEGDGDGDEKDVPPVAVTTVVRPSRSSRFQAWKQNRHTRSATSSSTQNATAQNQQTQQPQSHSHTNKSSLNHSFTTEKTADLSSILDTSNEMSLSMESKSSSLPNDLFTDAMEQLTEIAVATGIIVVPKDSSPSTATQNFHRGKYNGKDTVALGIDLEEPGRIVSAANSVEHSEGRQSGSGSASASGDDTIPFDEEQMNMTGGVVSRDGMKNVPLKEEMSAIVRMRYLRAVGKAPLDESEDREKPSPAMKYKKNRMDSNPRSEERIQNETIQRWKNMREEVSKKEARVLQLDKGRKKMSRGKTRIKESSTTITTSSGSTRSEDDSVDGLGLFDLSFLTKSLEDVWNQSQATLMEAVVGERRHRRSSGSSTYEDSDDESCASSSSSYDHDQEEEGDEEDDVDGYEVNRRGRRPSRASSTTASSHHDDSDESNDDEDHDYRYESANRNFLEDVTGHGIVLVWHRPRSNTSAKLFKKVRVNIQISDTEDGKMEPNLVWEAVEDRRREYQVPSRDKISLFDIVSIERASESLNLNSFPHAVADHSILITLNNGKVCLFEAKDAEHAERFIHGLRWMEGRLIFNIIMGNIHVCSEMLSINEQFGINNFTTDLFHGVTNQLVEKTASKIRN